MSIKKPKIFGFLTFHLIILIVLETFVKRDFYLKIPLQGLLAFAAGVKRKFRISYYYKFFGLNTLFLKMARGQF